MSEIRKPIERINKERSMLDFNRIALTTVWHRKQTVGAVGKTEGDYGNNPDDPDDGYGGLYWGCTLEVVKSRSDCGILEEFVMNWI